MCYVKIDMSEGIYIVYQIYNNFVFQFFIYFVKQKKEKMLKGVIFQV